MCGKYQKGRQNINTPNSEKGTRDSLSGGAGSLGGAAVWRLPLAQGVILGSQDRVPHQLPFGEPASPSAYVSASASLCISHE